MKECTALDREASRAHLTTDPRMIFKTLHDPKSQKDLDKDSKHDLYSEQMEMNPNSM